MLTILGVAVVLAGYALAAWIVWYFLVPVLKERWKYHHAPIAVRPDGSYVYACDADVGDPTHITRSIAIDVTSGADHVEWDGVSFRLRKLTPAERDRLLRGSWIDTAGVVDSDGRE